MSQIDDAIEELDTEIADLYPKAVEATTESLQSIYSGGNPGQMAMMDYNVLPSSDDWLTSAEETWPNVDVGDFYDTMMSSHDAAWQALSDTIGYATLVFNDWDQAALDLQGIKIALEIIRDLGEGFGGTWL